MSGRNVCTAALFAVGVVAGWWAARRDVAGVAGMLERAGRHPVPPPPPRGDITDYPDDAPAVPTCEPPGPWAKAARPAEFVLTGVCDPDAGGCGTPFAFRPWSVDVVEADGVCTVVGYCYCGADPDKSPPKRVCAAKHVDVDEAGRLVDEGACLVNVLRSPELDDRTRRHPWPRYDDEDLRATEVLLEDDDWLGEAVGLLAKKYGDGQ